MRQDCLLKDVTGRKISGKLVFSQAIQFLRKHMLDELEQRNTGVPEEYITWVITVPAIWNDACKQFMRESAEAVRSSLCSDRFPFLIGISLNSFLNPCSVCSRRVCICHYREGRWMLQLDTKLENLRCKPLIIVFSSFKL